MDIQLIMDKYLSRLPQGIATRVFNTIKDIPFVKKTIQKELDSMMAELEGSLKPYKDKVQSFAALPEKGLGKNDVIALMEDIEASKHLKKMTSPYIIRSRVRTSARRWLKSGILRTILMMWKFRLAYYFGASPETLARKYYG